MGQDHVQFHPSFLIKTYIMSHTLLLAQTNPTVGAIEKNTAHIIQIINTHSNHVIVFPELALTGYPPEDLLLQPIFQQQVEQALIKIKSHVTQQVVVLGCPLIVNGLCYNAAVVIHQHEIITTCYKQHLPNYGVFDEQRYFTNGPLSPCQFTFQNTRFGVCICEDLWHQGPVDALIAAHSEIILCINASPFEADKYEQRLTLLQHYAKQGVTMVYVNLVGGQDELIFDGLSCVVDSQGQLKARAPAFVEALEQVTLQEKTTIGVLHPLPNRLERIYQALVKGLYDYVEKNHFPGVLLGLSGGIDSALTLAIAVDALGPKRVQAILLPSRYSAEMSMEDALQEANILGVTTTTLSIEPAYATLLHTLAPVFEEKPHDHTEENIQARIRGVLLMALSNKTGYMLLSTSNKSETAVGYATLYGDMAGGLAVLKDVLKTTVYQLAHYRNTLSSVIPERVITRAPSAELAPNQTDQDHLPDYVVIDAIITYFMEQNENANDIIARGYPADAVLQIIQRIKHHEYKRRQAPPGIKITQRAFGKDWRMPITSGS